jgi:thiol-disulfide isomerase/thioredoxin
MFERLKNISLKKMLKEVAVFALLLFIASNLLSYLRAPKPSDANLPAITAMTLSNKQFDSLHVSHDKPLLLHFWATWCPTCKMENATIESLSKKFNVITVAVKSGSDEEIKQFLDEHGLSFEVINDANSSIAQNFDISGFPTTFIYNKEGKLEFSEMGYSSYLSLYLKLLYAGR